MKPQTSTSKRQRSSKDQIPNRQSERGLVLGAWDFSGAWGLVLGASSRSAAFTMIEIAISLAVIAFALVAIIGVLPTGMNVQKENREDTIIAQDAMVFMDAIRNGAQGLDDLTNYVQSITVTVRRYDVPVTAGVPQPVAPKDSNTLVFTYANSTLNGVQTVPLFPLSNGQHIIGLLSLPKYHAIPSAPNTISFYSNYVVAAVRSLSGAANEKAPQTNADVLGLSLSYRMVPEINPYFTDGYDPGRRNPATAAYYYAWTNYSDPLISADERSARSNFWMLAQTMQTNMHDVRLIFRWPLLPNGDAGGRRQIFRTSVGGWLMPTNDHFLPGYYPNAEPPPLPLISNIYFIQPRVYSQVPMANYYLP